MNNGDECVLEDEGGMNVAASGSCGGGLDALAPQHLHGTLTSA